MLVDVSINLFAVGFDLIQTIILVLSSSFNLSDKHLNKKSNPRCCHRDIEKVGKSKTMRIT
mgnify:CR=1 FL=1